VPGPTGSPDPSDPFSEFLADLTEPAGGGAPGGDARSGDAVDLLVTGPRDVVGILASGGVDGPLDVVLGLVLAEAVPGAHLVCGAAVRDPVDPGGAPRGPVDAGQVADLAAEMLVGAVVLVRVEADGPAPTRADVRRFVTLRHHCAGRGVALLDHVVIGAGGWWSLREEVLRSAA